MRTVLFQKSEHCYKANLHTHTTLSDGRITPEQIKKYYKDAGYGIVAFTDHEIMLPHTDLCDPDFLAMTGYELLINEPPKTPKKRRKTYHLNFYSPDNEARMFPFFRAEGVWFADEEKLRTMLPAEMFDVHTEKIYTVEAVNELIREANALGYLVSYNHPVWSLQDFDDYHELRGLWGVEWFNTSCDILGYVDDIKPVDDLLREGEPVFPLATDDTHIPKELFGGWCMVNASELSHKAVFESLKKGDFYSTTGPDILEIALEDDILTVKSSPVRHISVSTERRFANRAQSEDGTPITEARFSLKNLFEECTDEKTYFRVTLQDMDGNRAYSRAFFKGDW